MSAFLGPVHQWMYEKIQMQETFTRKLLELSKDETLSKELNEKFGVADTAPLEEIIDKENIHGWLNGHVERAEGRFAQAVEQLQKESGGTLDKLTSLAYEIGQEQAVSSKASVSETYQSMDSLLLDGMPCDGGRMIVSEERDALTFQYDVTLHTLYNQGDAGQTAFTALREAFLRGLLSSTALQLVPLGTGSYKITEEG